MIQKISRDLMKKANTTTGDIVKALMQSQMDFINKINFKIKTNEDTDLIEIFVQNKGVDKANFVLDIISLKIVLIDYVLRRFFEPSLGMEITVMLSDLYLSLLKHIHPERFEHITDDKLFDYLKDTHKWLQDVFISYSFLEMYETTEKCEKFHKEMYKSFCKKILGEVNKDILALVLFQAMVDVEILGTHAFCESLLDSFSKE